MSKVEITKAIINVMKEVKNIDKNIQVGDGKSAYKGVADKDVKSVIGQAMEKHGLAIIPLSINPKVDIQRWEETNNYGTKMKTQVFTEVSTKYLLLHESGESLEIEGYGHGIDSQDKSAGKATTYALKYALLYTFLVPTGQIDDTDKVSSEDIETPKTKDLKWLNVLDVNKKPTQDYKIVCGKIQALQYKSLEDIRKDYKISKETETSLLKAFEQYQSI